VPADPEFIGEVVDLLVMMKRRGSRQWRVEEIVACHGWRDGQYELETLSPAAHGDRRGNGYHPSNEKEVHV